MTKLLSVTEVAQTLGICAATVYKLCAHGRLEHVRILNSIRVSADSLRAFIRHSIDRS
jgi:excisionase family DNA binding protein